MLVRTDCFSEVRTAKVTLQGLLKRDYYTGDGTPPSRELALRFIAEEVRDIEFSNNKEGDLRITVSSVSPIGFAENIPDWPVFEIVEFGSRHQGPGAWEDFISRITARLILHLTDKKKDDDFDFDDRVATVEINDGRGRLSRFVVMDDSIGEYHKSDYIYI